jgi:hypothetical protein
LERKIFQLIKGDPSLGYQLQFWVGTEILEVQRDLGCCCYRDNRVEKIFKNFRRRWKKMHEPFKANCEKNNSENFYFFVLHLFVDFYSNFDFRDNEQESKKGVPRFLSNSNSPKKQNANRQNVNLFRSDILQSHCT